MNYVLSYPRSGVTWFRYCVEELTGRPSLGSSSADLPICNRDGVDLDVDAEKNFILFKRHWWNGNEIDESDTLFLIIRNPVEVMCRHYTSDGHDMDKILNENCYEYMKNIRKFNQFIGEKYCMYYEDLIEDDPLREILKGLYDYLPAREGKLQDFMNKVDFHRKQSLDSYPKSHTKGEKKVYHQKKVSDEQKSQIRERLVSLNGSKTEDYLNRYDL